MKYISALLLLFMALHLNAQSPSFKLGAQFTHDNLSGEDWVYNQQTNYGFSIMRNEFNYTVGLTATIGTNSNFSFKSGLLYSNKDYISEYQCLACFYSYLSYYVPNPELVKQRFLSVPFQFNYRISKSKLSPVVQAGVISNFGVSDNAGIHQYNFLEGELGLGMAYRISNQLDVELSYQYRPALTAIYKNESFSGQDIEDYSPNQLNTNSFALRLNYSLN